MRNDTSSFVEKLKSQCNIVDVVSRYITLNRKGKTFWGCCPFHLEKTPSFAVNFEEQFYHCFGCGESGDVITFVKKQENCDFVKALEILSKDAGIEMPEFVFNEEIGKLKKKKEIILKINKDAAKFYNKKLNSKQGQQALNYLKKRGLTIGTITKFGIGLSPDWNEVVNYLTSLGYSRQDIFESGIADQKNGRIYDAFAGRVMFPIINTYGDVVGFSGRTMSADKTIAKYKNTRDTIVFDKSRCVFALNLVKKFKQTAQLNKIILVEGQMDVIKMFEAGYYNCVASLGTSLTKYHAKEIKRFCDNVVVLYDGDTAGQKATLRSLDILESEGLNVTVVSLPDGLDPDEYVSKFGKDSLDKLLDNADSTVDYKIKVLAKKYNISKNNEKTMFIKEALSVLKARKNAIDADVYISTISKLTDVSKEVLRKEINQDTQQTPKNISPTKTVQSSSPDAYVRACRFYLASLLHKRPHAKEIADKYFKFSDSTLEKLYEFAKLKKPISMVFDEFDTTQSPQINQILNEEFAFSNTEAEQKFYNDSVREIIIRNITQRKEQILNEFKTTKNAELLQELKVLDEKLTKIKQESYNG